MRLFHSISKAKKKQENTLARCMDDFCGVPRRRVLTGRLEFLPKLKCVVDELEDGRVLVTLSADYLRKSLVSISFYDDYLIVERKFVSSKPRLFRYFNKHRGGLRKSIKSYYIPDLDESSLSYLWQADNIIVSLKKKSVEAVYDRARIQK